MRGTDRRRVALALRGGGSHGAFTRGALDRLLKDESLEVIGATGSNACAMPVMEANPLRRSRLAT
jgi:NTE family protein